MIIIPPTPHITLSLSDLLSSGTKKSSVHSPFKKNIGVLLLLSNTIFTFTFLYYFFYHTEHEKIGRRVVNNLEEGMIVAPDFY